MLSQGSILESQDFLTRTANTLNSTLPVEARQLNAQEAIPMRNSICAPTESPNADGRLYAYDNDGQPSGGMYAKDKGVPVQSAINCERYEVIPPKGKKTICFSPLSGIFQSNMCWPLPHCSITCELQLVSDPAEVCADSTDPNTAPDSNAPAIARSQSWHLELPRMNLAFLQMSSVANAEWDSIIASKGLHFSVSQYVTLQHQVTDKSPRLQFFRSLANCEALYLTLFRPYFTAPTDDPLTNKFLTQWGQAFQKEANYLFSGVDEIIKKCTPNQRNTPDADGVPTTSNLYAADATPALKQALATTADTALGAKQTQFQVRWGAKQIPEVPVKAGELAYHNKLTAGVEALREGFGMQPSFDNGRRIFSCNLEAYPAHLSEQGLSSRAGESIQCLIVDGGTDAIHAVRAYLTLVYEQRLSLRTGAVRALD